MWHVVILSCVLTVPPPGVPMCTATLGFKQTPDILACVRYGHILADAYSRLEGHLLLDVQCHPTEQAMKIIEAINGQLS